MEHWTRNQEGLRLRFCAIFGLATHDCYQICRIFEIRSPQIEQVFFLEPKWWNLKLKQIGWPNGNEICCCSESAHDKISCIFYSTYAHQKPFVFVLLFFSFFQIQHERTSERKTLFSYYKRSLRMTLNFF